MPAFIFSIAGVCKVIFTSDTKDSFMFQPSDCEEPRSWWDLSGAEAAPQLLLTSESDGEGEGERHREARGEQQLGAVRRQSAPPAFVHVVVCGDKRAPERGRAAAAPRGCDHVTQPENPSFTSFGFLFELKLPFSVKL